MNKKPGRAAGRPSRGLVLRDARPGDRQAILGFTRRTWGEYGDFIHKVWRSWIADKSGRFIVAELGGVPVGTAKINDFGRGQIWLEGLRVDPAHRGEGIARAINLEVLRTLARMRPRAVRYSTGAGNRASRHIGGRFGFRVAGHFRYYWGKSRRGKLFGERARGRDADAVWRFVKASRYLARTGGLVAEGWVFREATPELVRAYIRRGQVMVVRDSGKIVGAAIYPLEKSDRWQTVGFLDGPEAVMKALAANCRHLAAARGGKECSVVVPSRHCPRAVEAAGFKRKQSMGQVVLEYAGKVGRTSKSGRAGRGAGRR
ncbi:MAG: GNAT family N-acetyltransferase [bacterium]